MKRKQNTLLTVAKYVRDGESSNVRNGSESQEDAKHDSKDGVNVDDEILIAEQHVGMSNAETETNSNMGNTSGFLKKGRRMLGNDGVKTDPNNSQDVDGGRARGC